MKSRCFFTSALIKIIGNEFSTIVTRTLNVDGGRGAGWSNPGDQLRTGGREWRV